MCGGGLIGGNLEGGGGREDDGSSGGSEGRGTGVGGGAAGIEEDIVSGGALGPGFVGWWLKYCCTSSVPGDCGSATINDCKLINERMINSV